MERVHVRSSAIRWIAYEPTTRRMQIQFTSSTNPYDYCNVPVNVYEDFLRSSSKGTYYDRHIKDRYDCF